MERQRRRLAIVMIAAIAVLAAIAALSGALAGCGASDRIYTDPTYGYSLAYPTDWEVQEGSSDVTAGGKVAGNVGVYHTKGTKVGDTYVDLAMVMVYSLNFTVDDPWATEIQTELEGVLSSLEDQITGAQVERALSQTTMAQLKGYTITYTFTKDGTPMRSTLYFVFDGNLEYELTEQAAVSAWDATKPALDGIIASFIPGKPK